MIAIRAALLATAVSFVALFSSAWAQTAEDGGKNLTSPCQDSTFLESCPNTCRNACENIDFYRSNIAMCDSALDGNHGEDPAHCMQVKIEIQPLQACIRDASAIPRKANRILERTEERRAFSQAYFSEIPECAQSVIGLREMYACLDGEADVVAAEYNALGTFEIDMKDTSTLTAQVCALDLQAVDELDLGAIGLENRANELIQALRGVSVCRQDYETWLQARGEVCERPEFVNFLGCEQFTETFSQEIDSSLKQAQEQNAQIDGVVERIKQDLNNIVTIAMIHSTSCVDTGMTKP